MAEIITKDSEEFRELAGWIRKTGRAVAEATERLRPTIADEHYLQVRTCARFCTFPNGHCRRCGTKGRYLTPLSGERYFIPKAHCMKL